MPFLAAAAPAAAAGAAGTSAATAAAVSAAGVGVAGGSMTAATIGAGAAASSGFSLASLATYASLGAGALGAVSAISGGINANRQAQMQARLFEQQAERDRLISAQEEDAFRRAQSRAMASRRALLGGSGVEAGTGSPLLVSEDMQGEIELQALKLRNNGAATSSRLIADASMARWAGRQERTQGFIRGGASLLQGAGYAYGRRVR